MHIDVRKRIYNLLSVTGGISHDQQEMDRLDSYSGDSSEIEEDFEDAEESEE